MRYVLGLLVLLFCTGCGLMRELGDYYATYNDPAPARTEYARCADKRRNNETIGAYCDRMLKPLSKQ